jgi:hypothetical protein
MSSRKTATKTAWTIVADPIAAMTEKTSRNEIRPP